MVLIPDFSLEKSASSEARGRVDKSVEDLSNFAGSTQIFPVLNCVLEKSGITFQSRQNPMRILSRNPFGANFSVEKFGFRAS
jgi:hypothetical protein